MQTIKNFLQWLLSILGVILLIEFIRNRMNDGVVDIDLDDSHLTDKIDDLKDELLDIETSDVDIDDILKDWNNE